VRFLLLYLRTIQFCDEEGYVEMFLHVSDTPNVMITLVSQALYSDGDERN